MYINNCTVQMYMCIIMHSYNYIVRMYIIMMCILYVYVNTLECT